MRGRGNCVRLGGIPVGITPAYAGKSLPSRLHLRPCRDHPRVCGEEYFNEISSLSNGGSPPRMRGRATFGDMLKAGARITPAYAGKRSRTPWRPGWMRDHPRVCGEESSSHGSTYSKRGSPPRMRGRGVVNDQRNDVVGITPAYAGKSV